MGVFQIVVPICIVFVTFLLKLSVQYRELSVENDDLCSPIKKRKINLYKDDNSALLVTQTQLNRHPVEWKTNFRCKFEVKSGFYEGGIMAVIQRLDFRMNDTTRECIDYVEFTAKDGTRSQKFCGVSSASESMALSWGTSPGVIAKDVAFIDDKGEMDVFIYVSKKSLHSWESSDIFIAFTSYKYCYSNLVPIDKLNLRPCRVGDDHFCMYKGFKEDDVINCPYTDCVDLPEGCDSMKPKPPNAGGASGESIFYGAISSLFITFGIFVCCIMVLRARHLLCFGDRCANPRSRTDPPEESRVMEMGESPSPATPQPHGSATAPPMDDAKDLPPSYDSLFPSISAR